jgi:cytochrome c peroxidase
MIHRKGLRRTALARKAMKASSAPRALASLFAAVVAMVVAVGFYGEVRAQSGKGGGGNGGGGNGDVQVQSGNASGRLIIPLRPLAPLSSVKIPPVYGMDGIIADQAAAIQLGKALFWDMQAGSDEVQACATCHFNAGADSRAVNQVNPGQAGGDNSFQFSPNHRYRAGTPLAGFGGYHDGDFPFHKLANPNDRFSTVSDVNDVSGSQGVFARDMGQVQARGNTDVETSSSVPDAVFSFPDPSRPGNVINTRQATGRNTPSNVNAVFNFRNFWDGRAQNVCNGVNPFGARDKQAHLVIYDAAKQKVAPAVVGMPNSSLCSQALGPILSSVEMSAANRDFRQVGRKLLSRRPLALQRVDRTDSVLGIFAQGDRGLSTSYAALIQKAFLPEWWQFTQIICAAPDGSVAGTIGSGTGACPANTQPYSQMEYNFSLFWGVAIQAYESTLVSDQTPLDKYLEQQQTFTLLGDNRSNSYTIQLNPGLDPHTISVVALNPNLDMSDQDVFGFDDGFGRFIGTGIDGTIDYSTGVIVVNFEDPPTSEIPVKISYSTGPTPMTEGQLRGLVLFQTKGRCIVCHGGPELSNATVANVAVAPLERMFMGDFAVRVYDTGYYHIGVRTGAEDAGLAGSDPVAGLPLSLAEELQQRICKDPSLTIMVPGRPGDGITQAPLNCRDQIARTGFFKTPQLRNIALTAPYFHDGGQLTLEQVVEFYNRGGDFNTVSELHIMDPDVEDSGLGLTLQEKQDLVDFMRNALTDQRTVTQAAPFDHPQLFLPNGHPAGAQGYPVQPDASNPGQATTQYIELPAVGAKGGKPLATFLENMLQPATSGPGAELPTVPTVPEQPTGPTPPTTPTDPAAGPAAPTGPATPTLPTAGPTAPAGPTTGPAPRRKLKLPRTDKDEMRRRLPKNVEIL